jgi:hypothetical protein
MGITRRGPTGPLRVFASRHGLDRRPGGYRRRVFLFFSNRLGCGGSLLLSAAMTLLLLLLLGVVRL